MSNDWYLTVNHHYVGKTYRSLTQQLLFSRWLTNQIFMELRVENEVVGKPWEPVEIRIVFNGVEQAKDVI